MRMQALTVVVLAASAGCGSEAPDDKLNPTRAQESPRLVSAQEALDTVETSTLDPHTMNDAEIRKVLGKGRFCAFRYVSDGKPVLAWKRQAGESNAVAVVKLNGVLVRLHNNAAKSANEFVADAVRLIVTSSGANQTERRSAERPQEAKLVFEIDQQLRVGYGGYSVCPT